MKITLRQNIKCPKCSAQPKIETGFWGSFFMANILGRFEKEGGIVTCGNCKFKYEVSPNRGR